MRWCEDFAVHWEMLNGFKGLLLFFRIMNSNIALTFPSKYCSELIGCLEGREMENFGQVSNGFIPWTDVKAFYVGREDKQIPTPSLK